MGNYFTYTQAVSKIGKKIKAKVDFSGVPKGTFGTVLEPYDSDVTPDGTLVRLLPIQWNLPERKLKTLVDWFTKDEFEKFLEIKGG